MKAAVQIQNDTGIVTLGGRFTFEGLQVFKGVTEPLLEDSAVRTIHLDLGTLEHMDASSLGMLLVLREKAEMRGKLLVLVALAPCASVLLESVHFGKLFRIGK
jgi:anti-anti-sigma factor